MIGASAAVSGMMAAAIRFAFQHGSFLSFRRGDTEAAARVPALSLMRSLQNSSVLGFLAVWFGLNIITGLGAIAIGASAQSIAWQAHIGGFIAGLVLFSLFDPVPRSIVPGQQCWRFAACVRLTRSIASGCPAQYLQSCEQVVFAPSSAQMMLEARETNQTIRCLTRQQN